MRRRSAGRGVRGGIQAIEEPLLPRRRGGLDSESNFFENDWSRAYWGANYPRLLAVKNRYDPDGLFFVHHGVGSERWSADGFTRPA